MSSFLGSFYVMIRQQRQMLPEFQGRIESLFISFIGSR